MRRIVQGRIAQRRRDGLEGPDRFDPAPPRSREPPELDERLEPDERLELDERPELDELPEAPESEAAEPEPPALLESLAGVPFAVSPLADEPEESVALLSLDFSAAGFADSDSLCAAFLYPSLR